MPEELGRLEKPPVSEFKKGRKLLFVPLIFAGKDSPADFLEKFNRYWNQVENQLGELELKLGKISRIYHELISTGGDEGVKVIRQLSENSYRIVENRLSKGGKLEATEDEGLLTEITDCQRCISIGLQNQKVFNMIYSSYSEASQKRNEFIAHRIDETLGSDEMAIMLMAERHQVRFPSDIQVFYVAPPALDEINRWLRDRPVAPPEEKPKESQEQQPANRSEEKTGEAEEEPGGAEESA
jgi:hypothetical protein